MLSLGCSAGLSSSLSQIQVALLTLNRNFERNLWTRMLESVVGHNPTPEQSFHRVGQHKTIFKYYPHPKDIEFLSRLEFSRGRDGQAEPRRPSKKRFLRVESRESLEIRDVRTNYSCSHRSCCSLWEFGAQVCCLWPLSCIEAKPFAIRQWSLMEPLGPRRKKDWRRQWGV